MKNAHKHSQHRGSKAELRDYKDTSFSLRIWLWNIIVYLLLDAVVSYLFFRSAAAFAVLLPGIVLFILERKRSIWKARKAGIRREFLTGIQFVSASLQAGYSIENAFMEALAQLRRTYPPESFSVREFGRICSRLGLNRPLESILRDLSARSHVEDIESFTEAFCTARRSGGDLSGIIRNTVLLMQQKDETQREIETILAGKQMEYVLMSGIPIFILIYVNFTSPGFLDPVYKSSSGLAVMGVAFGIYLVAFLWGRKILDSTE